MKKAIIALLCLALIAGGGYFGFKQYEKNRDEKIVVDVIPLSMIAEPSEYFMMSNTDTWGYISAANAQRVYVDTNKLVQTVCVEQGDTVKKGDTILEYDMTVVELELAQKENQVHLIEQEIKMAQKELANLRSLRPLEESPYNQTEPEPDVPDEPEEPDIPEPIIPLEELTGSSVPAGGTGTEEDPLIYNCTVRTVVHKAFQMMLAGSKRCAALHVYDDSGTFLFRWILSGSSISDAGTEDWAVTDGLTFDTESGTVSIDPEGTMHGQLSFALPVNMMPDDWNDDQLPEDWDNPDSMPDMTGDAPADYGENYMYSRKELQRMITEKENEIKELELNLKAAQLAFETAQKQKSDGKVVAAVDGVVKKIGKAAGEEDTESEAEKDPFAEPSEDDNAFAVIEGAGGVEVICEIPESYLSKVKPGTVLNVMSYQNGAMTEAEVTGYDEEPTAYSVSPWQANPNSSMYNMHARLMDSTDFVIGSGVQVSLPQNDANQSGSQSYCMPIHYVRQEGGDYYIMKADENDRLVKQYISAGQILWGYYIEVTGGLDLNDRVCFPYGTDVKEGVRTQNSTEVLYPSSY